MQNPPKIKLSCAQKWMAFKALHETAWKLKWAAVKQAHPDWNDEQIRMRVREIFLNATT
jgi:hypothetical protein